MAGCTRHFYAKRGLSTAAQYAYMDLVNGSQGEGLTEDELRTVVGAFNVPTTLV